jgi:hypothetical protein
MTATVFAQRATTDRSAQRATADKSAQSALVTGLDDQDTGAVFEMLSTNVTPPLTILRCIKAGCIRIACGCAEIVIA